MESENRGVGFWVLLAFVLGACSMAYELLIARALSDLFAHEVLCQSLTVGVFLLGMGWGAWRSTHRQKVADRELFVRIEVFLAIVGAAGPVLVMAVVTFVRAIAPLWVETVGDSEWRTAGYILALQPITFWIGALSGWELPLLMRLAGPKATPILLAASYFGGLAGSWFVPLAMGLRLSPQSGAWLVGAINWVMAFWLVFALWSPLSLRWLGKLMLAWALIFGIGQAQSPVLSTYLKIEYGGYTLQPFEPSSWVQMVKLMGILEGVQRRVTAFQNLDIVEEEFFTTVGREPEFSLYLNRRPQFSAGTHQSYHESLVHGGLNLAGTFPEHVFVFGGGDGLVAAELLKLPFIKKVTLIELDPEMIRLSRDHPKIAKLNNDSLRDPRVEVIIDDAFAYMRGLKAPIEAVFIDFPYPDGFDTAKLFSTEFFAVLKSRLAPSGFAVMDAPIWRTLDSQDDPRPFPQDILLSTLQVAGVRSHYLFGTLEPFLFIPGTERERFLFEYEKLPDWLHNRTRVNLSGIEHILGDTLIRNEYANSIFKPRKWK